MKRGILTLAFALAAACNDPSSPAASDAAASGTAQPPSFAAADENFDCIGTASGSFANVFVPAGKTCRLENSTVSGNVLARERSRLFVSDTRVDGNIDGVEARVVQVRGGSLGGSIQIADGSSGGETGAAVYGGTVLSQGNIQILKMNTGTIRIEDVVLRKGTIMLQENRVRSSLDILRNRVGQNLQVFKNAGSGAKQVRNNRVAQTLECKENTSPFVGGPNTAGEAKEQCF